MVNIVSNIHICKYTPIDYQFINNSNGLLFADKTCSRLIDHITDEHEYYDYSLSGQNFSSTYFDIWLRATIYF